MTFCVFGLSHKTAPLRAREKLAKRMHLENDESISWMRGIADELLLLSTCNRVEIIAFSEDPKTFSTEAKRHFMDLGLADDAFETYEYRDEKAIEHVLRVACSLDSLVVGEPQILGQIKEAYYRAGELGLLGKQLNSLFPFAFSIAKRTRTETSLSEGSVSISSIAVTLAERIYGNLSSHHIVVVGAGMMAEATARALKNAGAALSIANRDIKKARALAEGFAAEGRSIDDLDALLEDADIAIFSTSSTDPIVDRKRISKVMKKRKYRQLLLVDIAVPRDVAASVSSVDGVFLYDIDDLEEVAKKNLGRRENEAQKAERIVKVATAEFEKKRKLDRSLRPTIVELRRNVESIVRSEIERTIQNFHRVDEQDREALRRMEKSLVNKLLHIPTLRLKESVEQGAEEEVKIAREILGLSDRPPAALENEDKEERLNRDEDSHRNAS